MKRRILATLGVVAFVIGVVAGCGTSSHTGTFAKVDCGVSIAKWYHNGGKKDVVILRSQFKPLLTATEAHQKGTVAKDAAGVEAAANTLRTHEPPNCVPNADKDLTAALLAVSNAASAASNNNAQAVRVDIKQADGSLKNIVVDVSTYVHKK